MRLPMPHPPPWASRAAQHFSNWRRQVKRQLGVLAPLSVQLYRGYGHEDCITIQGRVLERTSVASGGVRSRWWHNLRQAVGQLESDEVPDVELSITAAGHTTNVRSDSDGYFRAQLSLTGDTTRPMSDAAAQARHGPWLEVCAQVTRAPYPVESLPEARSACLIPMPSARFGVISDIDDTVLQTHVRRKLRMIYLTLLRNAATRRSFSETAALYRGMERAGGQAPFFYISHSMWNLYPMLEEFIDRQGLPRGPLLLRDLGWFHGRERPRHKLAAIQQVMEAYPTLPFVLSGDNGESDPETYGRVARAYPGRVRTILIRDVTTTGCLDAHQAQAQAFTPPECPVLVFRESAQAIRHLQGLELWVPDA